jgi:hypothetical protein
VREQTKELWLKLCEQAADEQDPEKFLTLIREINTLLELKRARFKQTGPQLVPDEPRIARCFLCDKPVPLDASKSDENGKAVHEECYLLKVRVREVSGL